MEENQKPKIKKLKLVFTGSVGAGKTLAISQLSEVPMVLTETKPTEQSVIDKKPTTTVAMDYGELTLSEDCKLYLYGTPGQRRFDFMSGILCQGALGLIILIDNTHPEPMKDLSYYIDLNEKFLKNHPLVIGVTHIDESPYPTKDVYETLLRAKGAVAPVFTIDARVKKDVLTLLSALINQLDDNAFN